MPASMMSPTRIITVFSLVALCIISFTVLFGSHNNLDTLTRDTQVHDSPFPLPKSNVIHERRALPHARATTSDPASESNPAPSQSAAATQASSQQPFSSPSPSFSSQPSSTDDNFSSAPSSSRAISTSHDTSAASSSASASPSSTLSSSSFSSSSARVSSSPGVISSTVEATSNIPNNPATTLANNPITQTSRSSGTVPTEPGSTVSVGPTSSVGATGFFGNKGAVGVTFSIVGILGGLAVIMGVLTLLRRRRRARRGRYAIEDEEFFEKYPNPDFNEPVPHLPPGFGSGSAAASITDVNMNAAPADAYPDRAIHYGQSNDDAVLNPVNYGIAYPPGAAHDNNSTPALRNGNTIEESGSEYSVPSAAHQFADHTTTSGPSAAPPVPASRPFAGRVQEMVTTDSYYGPNSAGVGAGGMGYAQ